MKEGRNILHDCKAACDKYTDLAPQVSESIFDGDQGSKVRSDSWPAEAIDAWQRMCRTISQDRDLRQRGMSWGVRLRLDVQAQMLGRSVDSEGGDYCDEGIDS